MAFGFVIARVVPWWSAKAAQGSASWSIGTGLLFLVLGIVCNAASTVRYLRIRKALLEGRPTPPGHTLVLVLSLGLALVGALLTILVLVH